MPNVIDTIMAPGRRFTSSYEEEKAALRDALEWLLLNDDHPYRVALICTDSQSLCTALLGQKLQEFAEILSLLALIQSTVHLQWIPGHSDIPGNELADAHAKEAAENQARLARPPISLGSANMMIKKIFRDTQPSHERTRQVYESLSISRDKEEIKNRKDAVLLARLRSGHHPGLRAWVHRVDPQVDPSCYICGDPNMDLSHWLVKCPGVSAERMTRFGSHLGSLDWLCKEPAKSVALARATLKWS